MSPQIVLLEIAALVGGVCCTLGGFGIVRLSRDPGYDGRHLQPVGGLLLLGAVVLPQVGDCGPYGRAAVISVLVYGAALAAYCVRTWRSDPPVPWPRGVLGWLALAVDSLYLTGAAAGLLAYFWAGAPKATWIACAVLGIATARTLDVWIARRHS